MNVDMMKLVDNVKVTKNLMTDEPVTERGWVLKRSGTEDYVLFGENSVTFTKIRSTASFFQNYADAIVYAKTRAEDFNLSLVVAERVKRDKQ